jgi:cob(I)alamin adenosyltransferase
MRLTKIVTRKGDDGKTSLDGKNRLPKNDLRIEALGTIDELCSAIGVAISFGMTDEIKNVFLQIQNDLFDLGGELCPPFKIAMTEDKIIFLEENLKKWNNTLSPLKEFLLPGGNPSSAFCHLARTICRRAERNLVALDHVEKLNPNILKYINRLSDVLFVAARVLGKNGEEKVWEHK